MSQSAIPQPNTAEPALQFSSTQGPPAQLPSEIQTPTPDTTEVPLAAGEGSLLDRYFYMQHVRITTVSWSTADRAGKLLWSVPLNPSRFHRQLAYFMKAYLSWGGDIEIAIRVLGTGFHAGQLALVQFPPSVQITEYTLPESYTVFPFEVMDVKNLAIMSFVARDMRPLKYHYTRGVEPDPNDWNIGGTLGLFADTQLSTASTGVQKINVAIYARLMPNFRVSFMLPPADRIPGSSDFPTELLNALVAPIETLSCSPILHAKFTVMPSSVKQLTLGQFGAYTFDSKPLSNKDNNINIPTFTIATYGGQMSTTITLKSIKTSWDCWGEICTVLMTYKDGEDTKQFAAPISLINFSDATTATFTLVAGGTVPAPIESECFVYIQEGSNKLDGYPSQPINIPSNKESFFMPTALDNRVTSVQSQAVSRLLYADFQNNYSEAIPRGQAALLEFTEVDSGLPLLYVKWYRSGVMTTLATTDVQVYDLSNKSFKFASFINVNTEIPANAQMAANRYAYLAYKQSSASAMPSLREHQKM